MKTKNAFADRILLIKTRSELNSFVKTYGWERFNAKLELLQGGDDYLNIYEHLLFLRHVKN